MPSIVSTHPRQRGFTLVELIMVIVVMGIIAGMVSVFMKSPIDAYVASGRRAALTDVADTVVRRIARDIQRALPNSIGTSGDKLCVEFIPTKTGGRYRADIDSTVVGGTPTDSVLSFDAVDNSFNMLGDNAASALSVDQRIAKNDLIVVYNLGITNSDAYNGDNTAMVSEDPTRIDPHVIGTTTYGTETHILTTGRTVAYPLASGSNRFQVIPANEKVVAYVCNETNLYRVASTTLSHICPVSPATGSATVPPNSPILAVNVDCTTVNTSWFNYSGPDLQRNALVSMVLTIKDSSGETVTLQHEVHVSNTP